MEPWLIIPIAFVVVILIAYIAIRNGLIGKRNAVENAEGAVDAMLKRRHDLIPNLVATVQQYMSHEQGTLTKITELRSQAIAASPAERGPIEAQLTQALRGLMVQVEAYPDLKASSNFLQLQASLNETEEQIAASRRAYNAAVTDYNNAIEMFPGSLFASGMGLMRRQVFEAEDQERETPKVAELFKQ
ncbi:MAG: LemA family protein [Armatimonadetes bacterium]|nr:LemA family protein [Armatimonadota bacterium]